LSAAGPNLSTHTLLGDARGAVAAEGAKGATPWDVPLDGVDGVADDAAALVSAAAAGVFVVLALVGLVFVAATVAKVTGSHPALLISRRTGMYLWNKGRSRLYHVAFRKYGKLAALPEKYPGHMPMASSTS
jgi:hypothetical protein